MVMNHLKVLTAFKHGSCLHSWLPLIVTPTFTAPYPSYSPTSSSRKEYKDQAWQSWKSAHTGQFLPPDNERWYVESQGTLEMKTDSLCWCEIGEGRGSTVLPKEKWHVKRDRPGKWSLKQEQPHAVWLGQRQACMCQGQRKGGYTNSAAKQRDLKQEFSCHEEWKRCTLQDLGIGDGAV